MKLRNYTSARGQRTVGDSIRLVVIVFLFIFVASYLAARFYLPTFSGGSMAFKAAGEVFEGLIPFIVIIFFVALGRKKKRKLTNGSRTKDISRSDQFAEYIKEQAGYTGQTSNTTQASQSPVLTAFSGPNGASAMSQVKRVIYLIVFVMVLMALLPVILTLLF